MRRHTQTPTRQGDEPRPVAVDQPGLERPRERPKGTEADRSLGALAAKGRKQAETFRNAERRLLRRGAAGPTRELLRGCAERVGIPGQTGRVAKGPSTRIRPPEAGQQSEDVDGVLGVIEGKDGDWVVAAEIVSEGQAPSKSARQDALEQRAGLVAIHDDRAGVDTCLDGMG